MLEVDVPELETKLHTLKAKKIGGRVQKRYVYDFNPKKEGSWVRLRTNGTKTTLTIKEIHSDNIDGTKELEITVDDFEKTNQLLEKLGYKNKGYQENKRVSYELDGVQIEIDFWPKIPPYMEVEAKSAKQVEETLRKLGFDPAHATSVNTTEIYKKYGINIEKMKVLKFL